jgi:S-adenosylmethionine synthetase
LREPEAPGPQRTPQNTKELEDNVRRWLFTSESVTEGHPDKMADQISDAILDAILEQDPFARVACETLLTTGLVVVAGEVTTEAYVEIPQIVREVVSSIGYTSSDVGFDGLTCGVTVSIGQQSEDIALGVDNAYEVRQGLSGEDVLYSQGAGDQGMMFGYACDETEDLMPVPIWLAHRLAQRLAQVRKAGIMPYLRPDGKTQVTFEYENGRPVRLRTVLVSTQHKASIDLDTLLKPDLRDHVVTPIVPPEYAGDRYQILTNPTGRFERGGPSADTGLTGRKVIVDTYGGAARHGGGAFSGKDPSKVDRSGAYAARWVAKHIVASGAASRCEVQVAYAIGVARPVSLMIELFGTEQVDPAKVERAVNDVFDLRPAAIIRDLDLRRPIYRRTAAYGHFGRPDKEFTWEVTSRLGDFKSALNL